MRRMLAVCLLLASCLLLCVAAAGGSPGTQQNPLISAAYLEQTVLPQVESGAVEEIGRRLDGNAATVAARQLEEQAAYQAQETALAARAVQYVGAGTRMDRSVYLQGDRIGGAAGCGFVIHAGSVRAQGLLIDVTLGQTVSAGATLTVGHYYMFSEQAGSTVEVLSANAQMGFDQGVYVRPERTVRFERYARALQQLGLFQGTNMGFELGRPSNRTEALVLFIRLLGEEEQALAYTGGHPFGDVPAWASRYVAYAYAKGYTKGMGNGQFGAASEATPDQYSTFLMRALGYREESGDFAWNTALRDAVALSVLPAESEREIRTSGRLYRDQIALISYQALLAENKNGTRLCDQLMQQGIFSASQWQTAQQTAGAQ